ncbi:MAG: Gfo/Idh/MocA family oxidoreductase [Chloroflexi bacterium]|nr:Gfo/Idh/MocA family oxidoreductase [Chloroflexota bacterium]
MSDRIRTAVIGTSWWADGAHLPSLKARDDVDVVAIAGRNTQRLGEIAAKYSIPAPFADYREMLATARPEVCVILTPHFEHHPMALAALEAGAHVICEKPLALSASEAAEMLARAAELGRKHLVFFTYRGVAGTRFVKQLIDGGYVGRLHHVSACYLHGSWLDASRPASWKTEREGGASGGVLGDLAPHVIDMLQWWFGDIGRVAGVKSTFIAERPTRAGGTSRVVTDDATAFAAEFKGGGQALAQVSRVAYGRYNYQRVEIYGSEGALVFDYERSLAHIGQVSGARRGEGDLKPLIIPPDLTESLAGPDTFPALHRRLTDPFFASLRGGPPSAPNFADGLAVQKVIDAVILSNETGRWEDV